MPPTDLDGLLDALSSLSMRSEYKPGFRTGPARHSGGGRGRGARFGGGRGARYSTVRRDGWGSSSTCAERHNVNRLPELDYFLRKLAAVLNDGECPRQWDLPYAKAGAAAALPDAFSSETAYLDAMQSAAALEFQVGAGL